MRKRGFLYLKTLTLVLALVFSCALCGCKYSDVLTQAIEDPMLGTVDEHSEPIYLDTPGAPPDPTRTSSVAADSERIDEQIQDIPDFEEDQPEENETDQRDSQEDSAHDNNASEGDEPSEADGTTSGNGQDGQGGAGSIEGQQGSETDQTQSEEQSGGDDPGSVPGGGIGGEGKVYDATGTTVELPENVGTVAATGQYATIVQMLAGKGGLVAADAEWVEQVNATGAFPDEGIESVAVVWSGTQEAGLKLDIDALITAAPDALLVDEASVSLDDNQYSRLAEAGIDAVTVPKLGASDTLDSDITAAVNIVGELLKQSSSQYDSAAMALKYVELHDQAISACLDANSGYSFKMIYGTTYPFIYQGSSANGTDTTNLSNSRITTAYIDSWTNAVNVSTQAIRTYSDFSFYLDGETIDASDGAGLSDINGSSNFMLLDYFLQVAGVVNNSYEGTKPVVSQDGEATRPYLVVPGDTRLLVGSGLEVSSRSAPSALWYSQGTLTIGASWLTVGDSAFPAVLVSTDEIAQRVVNSASKVNGLYNVGQSYQVYVVPKGLSGSWAKGTVESFLMAPWSYDVFHGGSLGSARSYVSDFYSVFYRCNAETSVDNLESRYEASCPRG